MLDLGNAFMEENCVLRKEKKLIVLEVSVFFIFVGRGKNSVMLDSETVILYDNLTQNCKLQCKTTSNIFFCFLMFMH